MGNELAYGNHWSALKHGEEVLKKAASEVAMGRTIVFPVTQAQEVKGLRINQLGWWRRKRTAGNPRLDVQWSGDRPRRKEGGRC